MEELSPYINPLYGIEKVSISISKSKYSIIIRAETIHAEYKKTTLEGLFMSLLFNIINTLSVIFVLIIIVITWRKRFINGASELFVLLIFMLIWTFGSFAGATASELEDKLFYQNLAQIGVLNIPPSALIFAITYSGVLSSWKKTIIAASYTLEALFVILIWTDPIHHLIQKSASIINSNGIETLVINTTTLAKVIVGFNYLFLLVSAAIIIYYAITSMKKQQMQILCLIVGVTVPITFCFAKTLADDMLWTNVPISGVFLFSNIFILLGVAKLELLAIEPIARYDLFNIIDKGVIITASDHGIIDVNDTAQRIFAPDHTGSSSDLHLSIERRIRDSFSDLYEAIMSCTDNNICFTDHSPEGSFYYTCDIYSVKNKLGKVIGSISVIADNTESKKQSDLLKYNAEHDGLTGTYNCMTFITKAKEQMQKRSADDANGRFAMLYFDVDDFKFVNDIYGHACGDYVIRTMCEYVSNVIGDDVLFGRIGGEEFAILIYATDHDEIISFGESVRRAVETGVFNFEGEIINVTISMGISVGGCSDSPEDLLRKADANLYKAKALGKNCVVK